jgi:hypothetical protein
LKHVIKKNLKLGLLQLNQGEENEICGWNVTWCSDYC